MLGCISLDMKLESAQQGSWQNRLLLAYSALKKSSPIICKISEKLIVGEFQLPYNLHFGMSQKLISGTYRDWKRGVCGQPLLLSLATQFKILEHSLETMLGNYIRILLPWGEPNSELVLFIYIVYVKFHPLMPSFLIFKG